MKIVFTTIPMKSELEALQYPVPGNIDIEYEKPVVFPVNAILAKSLTEKDNVKIILLMNSIGKSNENVEKFKAELNEINSNIKANLDFHIVSANFNEDKKTHEERFRKLLNFLEEDAEIITDITYGQKTLPLILFSVLNFAEKFFNCDIKYIIYGKVEFKDNKIQEGSQSIFDLTPLYYLNALTSAMEADDGNSAIKIIDNFFSF